MHFQLDCTPGNVGWQSSLSALPACRLLLFYHLACWWRCAPEHEGPVLHTFLLPKRRVLSVFSPSLHSLTPVSKRFHLIFPLLSALKSFFHTSFLLKKWFSSNNSLALYVLVCKELYKPGRCMLARILVQVLCPFRASLSSVPQEGNFYISSESSHWFLTLRFLPRLIRLFVQSFFQLLLSFESGTWKTFQFLQSGIMGFL